MMPANNASTSDDLPTTSAAREPADIPVVQVTVLEDRAQVERKATVHLAAGVNRLTVAGVSPLLQDVSLQARIERSVGSSFGASVRVVRSRRIQAHDRPEAIAELEAELDQLERQLRDERDSHQRATMRRQRLMSMLHSAARELPEDASWGRGDADTWRHAFTRLFERGREEDLTALDAVLAHERLRDDWQAVLRRRAQLYGPDAEVEAHAEIDLVADEAGEVTLTLVYIVPSALWRPLHRAEWVDGVDDEGHLEWTPRACVWQRTGEDWREVSLVLSTARTGAGTEPPLLSDDPLAVQRKQEQVRVAMRDVEIQSTAPGGDSAPPPDLPGVDDGGEARHLQVPGRVAVASTGRPTFFDLERRDLPGRIDVVAMPEMAQRAVRRVRFTLEGADPLLPGPVELLRHGGPFATTSLDFTAPGAHQELSFGPDDDVRVSRTTKVLSDKTDPEDRWRRRTVRVRVFLSNVGTHARRLELVERVPVSEVAVVRIEGVAAQPEAQPDADGHVRWSLTLPPNGRLTVELRHTIATAPDVQMD